MLAEFNDVKTLDAALRPYGYEPGSVKRWCAACGNEHSELGPRAFKCKPCAVKQKKEVDRLARSYFGEDDA